MSDIFDNQKLDPEEQELSDSIEKGEWVTAKDVEEEKKIAKETAGNYFRINVTSGSHALPFELNRSKD